MFFFSAAPVSDLAVGAVCDDGEVTGQLCRRVTRNRCSRIFASAPVCSLALARLEVASGVGWVALRISSQDLGEGNEDEQQFGPHGPAGKCYAGRAGCGRVEEKTKGSSSAWK